MLMVAAASRTGMIPTSTGIQMPGGADGVHPVTELVHIPAELGHDVVCALILLLLQEGDVGFQRTAGNVALRGACDGDGELVAEFLRTNFTSSVA